MKKRSILMILAAMLLLGNTVLVATAAKTPSATQNELHSQGAIHYQDGMETVVIDSADLYTLADRLDQFKLRVAEQLGRLNTYLSKDSSGVSLTGTDGVYVTHQEPSASNEMDPAVLSFDAILEGIAASQTIPTNPAAYGMDSGVRLYQGKDGKLQIGQKEGEGTKEVTIHKATARELSAGAAAWVDGKLILGTGDDNQSFCQSGSSVSGSGSGSSEDFSSVFVDFNTVGGYYGGFNGDIPYTFTKGKSVLLLFDGPFKPTFDGANLPDSAVTGRWFSLYYWKSNPHTRIKIKVQTAVNGYNDTLLLKEW